LIWTALPFTDVVMVRTVDLTTARADRLPGRRHVLRALLARIWGSPVSVPGRRSVGLAISYSALGLLPLADDRRAYPFALRLVGFGSCSRTESLLNTCGWINLTRSARDQRIGFLSGFLTASDRQR